MDVYQFILVVLFASPALYFVFKWINFVFAK